MLRKGRLYEGMSDESTGADDALLAGRSGSSRRSVRDICAPGSNKNGVRTWMFAGPVIDCTEVDPSAFTFCVEMCAPSDITGREAFARGVTKLV